MTDRAFKAKKGLQTAPGTAAEPAISFYDDSDTGLFRTSTNTLGIAASGVEQATFANSATTNFQVVSSSDTVLLDISENTADLLQVVNTDDDIIFEVSNTTGTAIDTPLVINDSGNNYNVRIEGSSEENLVFVNASTNRVGIGTSTPSSALEVSGNFAVDGNVGVSTTLGDWDTGFRVIQIGPVGSLWSSTSLSSTNLSNNALLTSSGYKYLQSVAATNYGQNNGIHYWFTAGSGTAGNAISFTQSMTLDASGNLGIGTSSPAATLDVRGSAIFNESGGDNDFRVESDTNANMLFVDAGNNRVGIGTSSPGATLDVNGSLAASSLTVNSNTGGVVRIQRQDGAVFPGDTLGTIEFYTNDLTNPGVTAYIKNEADNGSVYSALTFGTGLSGSVSESMRINSSGNLINQIGAVFNESGVDSDFRVESDSNANMLFVDAGNNRVGIGTSSPSQALHVVGNIVASGDLLVGTTTAVGVAATITRGTGSGAGPIMTVGTVNNTGSCIRTFVDYTDTRTHIDFYRSSTAKQGSITGNGNTISYNTSSDYRLKHIDGPIQNSGAYIDSLNPVRGSWIEDGKPFIGLIAHEVQEVSETPIATGVKDGEEMQGMDYSAPEIIANLIAEIQSLRARVAQLEGA